MRCILLAWTDLRLRFSDRTPPLRYVGLVGRLGLLLRTGMGVTFPPWATPSQRSVLCATRWPNCTVKRGGCFTPLRTQPTFIRPGYRTKRAASSAELMRGRQTWTSEFFRYSMWPCSIRLLYQCVPNVHHVKNPGYFSCLQEYHCEPWNITFFTRRIYL